MLYEVNSPYEKQVFDWIQSVVVGLNLCPFAAWPLNNQQVRIAVTDAKDDATLLADIDQEVARLDESDPITLETTLVVAPHHLASFDEYLNMLSVLEMSGWEGVYQIASFHPDYCFEGIEPSAVENHTNRAPYPIFHLLREQSVEKALAHYDDPEQIPENNIKTLQNLSPEQLKQLFGYLIP